MHFFLEKKLYADENRTETLMQTNSSMQTLTDAKVKPYDEIHSSWNFWRSGATSGLFTSQGYEFREAWAWNRVNTEAEICICLSINTGMLICSLSTFQTLINASSQRTKMFWISSQHCTKKICIFMTYNVINGLGRSWDFRFGMRHTRYTHHNTHFSILVSKHKMQTKRSLTHQMKPESI